MKYFIYFIVLIFIAQSSVFAIDKVPELKYNGDNYWLLFSAKTNGTGSYINEYYKKNETYIKWSELIAVHHFPEAYYPIEHAVEFYNYLKSNNVVLYDFNKDEDKNTAVIDFIAMSDKSRPIVLEYNIFRYEKDKICGSIAMQYAKRHFANNRIETKKIINKIEKNRKKSLKQFNKLMFPELILADIDNGRYLNQIQSTEEDKSCDKQKNESPKESNREVSESSFETENDNNNIINDEAESTSES